MSRRADERSPIRRLINASYDLDICKNYFNGRELIVRSWKKLIYRYDYIKCNMRYVMKYYEDYCGCKDPSNCIMRDVMWHRTNLDKARCGSDLEKWKDHIDMEVTEERMMKYRSRGFDIQLHPQNDEIIRHVIKNLEPNDGNPQEFYDRPSLMDNGTINLDLFYID